MKDCKAKFSSALERFLPAQGFETGQTRAQMHQSKPSLSSSATQLSDDAGSTAMMDEYFRIIVAAAAARSPFVSV